jgi:outer membrane protein assembly factor BamB
MTAGFTGRATMNQRWTIISFLALSLTSCPLLYDDKAQAEPVYNSRIVWKAELAGRGSIADTLYVDGYAYIQESSLLMTYNGDPFCRMAKVRLSDGEIMWKTADVDGGGVDTTDNPVKIRDKLFLPVTERGRIFVYDDMTGLLVATVKLGPTDNVAQENGIWLIYSAFSGPYIFWGKSLGGSDEGGLMRFDTRRIDYSRDSHEDQMLEPERVFKDPELPHNAIKNIREEDGIVYFLTANGRYNFEEDYAVLAAMEADTAAILWSRNLSHIEGGIPNSLVINGAYLHIIDKAPSCYLKATGEAVYEFDDRKRDPQKDYYLSGSNFLKGISLCDNKLYYCTNLGVYFASLLPKGLGNNIICLDAATGKLIWGDLVPDGGSQDTFPVIINGKAFVLTDQGLRVYNAQTGKLIGADKNIWNRSTTVNYGYQGMFIGFDIDHEPGISHLIAIRAD